LLTPKAAELIASPRRFDGNRDEARSFFEQGLGHVFQNIRESQHYEFPLSVYYAFKQSESDDEQPDPSGDGESPNVINATASTGWETMLEGLIKAGFAITGTLPMRSERGARSRSLGSNALASSIILVCRPRRTTAATASRREFLTMLKRELPKALLELQYGNIAPVDLAQAAIGPGMAVFSRYTNVIEADGKPMTVRTALHLINQALDEVLTEQEGEFDSDTRWAIAWFDQYGMDEGPFGTA
jgi:putative DNA methylase